jgi:LPS export ABC transporter permease LptG/LPS export ABC transporter permease LptF
MTGVLDRYVYREALPAVSIAVVVFTALHLLDRIQDFTNLLATGAPAHLVAALWGILVLSFLTHTVPMGLLVGVVMSASRLASDLEVVALGAAGVSPLRLVRPFLVVGAGAALVVANLTWWVNPWGVTTFGRLLAEVQAGAAAPLIQERAFTSVGGLVIYAEEAAPVSGELRGLVVADEQDRQRLRIITASSGRLVTDRDRRRTVLRLSDGVVHESSGTSSGWYRVTNFKSYDTPLDVGAQTRASRPRPDREMTAWELVSHTRALEWTRNLEQAEMFITELHKRFTYPMTPIVFAMVGFGLGVRLQRGGRAGAAVGGVVLLLVYHLLQEFAVNVGLPRAWGTHRWAPVVVFGVLGVALIVLAARPVPPAWGRTAAQLVSMDLGASKVPRSPFLRSPRRRRDASTPRGRPYGLVVTLADRYLARQFVAYLAAGLLIAAASFAVVDLLETIQRYLDRRPPWSWIAEHYAYRLPAAMHQALPVVVLIATVLLFVELARRQELTAFKAAGISLQRLARPVLVVAVLLSAGAFVFQETALPALNARADAVDRLIRGQTPRASAPQRHVWYRQSDSEFFRVGRLDPAQRQAADVTLVELDASFRVVRRVDVERAVFTAGAWTLTPGVARSFGPDNAVRTMSEARPAIALPDVSGWLEPGAASPVAMTARELYTALEALRARGREPGTWLLHLHTKLAFPLLHVALALVAIGCAVRWGQGGRLVGGAIAVGIAIAYWGVNSLALSLGLGGLLPPVLAAWTATIVFGGTGAALFLGSPS